MDRTPGLVSILIVAHNAAATIGPTIESCLNQTYGSVEILVLDNASADATAAVLESYRGAGVMVRRSEENIGPYRGLNILLERARGEYVAVQDHDDLWLPRKLERQVAFLDQNPGFIACGTETYNYYEPLGEMIADGRQGTLDFVAHPSLVFRNSGFRYEPGVLLADEHFERVILRRAGPIYCLDEPLTIHRIQGRGKNYSYRRFRLDAGTIREVLAMRGRRPTAWAYLLGAWAAKHLPTGLTWRFRYRLLGRRMRRMTLEEFRRTQPGLRL